MKETLYRIRRDVCRWIVGFDTCPSSYRRNPWSTVTNALIVIGLALGVIAFFFLLLICL